MAFEVLAKKVSISGLAAGSMDIALPKRSVRRIVLGARYTVTDASIVANEDLQGFIKSIKISADNHEIFRADRDELARVTDLLASWSTDSMDDPDDLNTIPATASRCDLLPTTAEEQRAHYVFNYPHDFSLYKGDVIMTIEWNAVTTEWLSATGFTGVIYIGLHYGNVPRSITLTRVSTPAGTEHDIPMGDFPVVAALFIPSAYNDLKELVIKGKDGANEYYSNEQTTLQAMYSLLTGVAPSSDDAAFLMTPPLLVPVYDGRRAHATFTTGTTTLVSYFLGIAAEAKLTPSVTMKGAVARGQAEVQTRSYSTSLGKSLGASIHKLPRKSKESLL